VLDIRQFEGRTALVTGAAKRLGRETALRLAACGINVVAHYRSSAVEAEALAAHIRAQGGQAWPLSADLADSAQAENLISRAQELAGVISILINSAAIFPETSLSSLEPDDLIENINVNAMAPLLIARAFARQGTEGTIVNILDSRILDYDKSHVAYHLSKQLLFSLTRIMAIEFAPKIRVNAVAPGLVMPPVGKDERYLQELVWTTPLNRHGSPQDVSEAVVFLLRSDFVTGQVLYVDGGRHLKGTLHA
jgi:NAD(P)-dependent dehydrogenase (short-subunit alcohol dehydrogenase family)